MEREIVNETSPVWCEKVKTSEIGIAFRAGTFSARCLRFQLVSVQLVILASFKCASIQRADYGYNWLPKSRS